MSHQTQYSQEHPHRPYEDMPVTYGWPVLTRVEIETRSGHAPHAPVRQKAVVQVLDFYREEA